MTTGIKTIIFPVADLDRAKAVLGALTGAEPTMDAPYYVQYDVAGQEIGLDPNGHQKGMTGPLGYWHVADINLTLDALLAAGAVIDQPVQDVGGRLIASVKDADGNPIGLLQPS